ncbi:MAG TPA: HAMP domain-containing sensor histidine kinase [Nitrososphaeraceae archaeon]|nr:HAMP domain-containing sensor histidine kinase [Nitrososphaeraceae archaeon]
MGKSTVLHGAGVINSLLEIISNTKTNSTTDICGNSKFPSKIFSYDSVTKLINTSLRERDVKQRYIFEITKDNVIYCKNLIKMGNGDGNNIDIHHMNDIEANFALNQTEYLGSMTLSEHNQQAIYSNIPEIVEQQHSIFESLWKKSIPAEDILEEIELGVEPEFFEVIADSQKATEIYLNLAKFLQKEGLIIYADSRALNRAQKLGVLDYLIIASSQRSAKIKIICPLDEFNSGIVKQISEKAPDIKILNGGNSQSGLFVADEKEFLRFEIKDAKAPDFSQAIGFIVYSNSKSGVSSSKSMFELIWNEHVQYQKIKEYEKQKEANKLKDEFINIAAHELRTPIQPILGLSNVLLSKTIDPGIHDHLLRVIIRNAERLQKLADSILDVTRIESGLLKLRIEKIKIHDLIVDILENYTDQIDNPQNQRIVYESDREDFVVKADRERITQVICNLLNNAVKFSEETKSGEDKTITIATNRFKKEQRDYVTISIRDMGTGIDAQIFPQLFSRFTSKSFSGTGLGLFISKSIVEAHGGKIWAENNASGKGSTFTFTLPIINE